MANDGGPPRAAIGCMMIPLGALSMAMVGVLISKVVAWATKSKCNIPDIPTCDWYVYAGWGALVGAVTLPLLVTWRMRRPAAPENSKRG